MGINDFIKIGNSLKEIRKNHSLTQEEMAKALNIPRSTYANYENNKREPSKELLEKISEVFNIPLIDKPVSIFSGPGGEQLKKSLSMPINNDIKKYFDSPITKNALIELINNEYNEKMCCGRRRCNGAPDCPQLCNSRL